MSPIQPPSSAENSKPDPARVRRILFRAAIATVLYAIIVVIWPRVWRQGLFFLGGAWSGLISWENRGHWRLKIPQIHEQLKQGRVRTSVSEKVLAVGALCLFIYGIAGFF
jgi:hypothetical protein